MAGSSPSPYSERLTGIIAFHIMIGDAEIEATLAKGYKPECVKTAMFESMEGMATDHAANIDQYGVLTALEILEGLDRLYGISMTFQSLNSALCGLQQRVSESCQRKALQLLPFGLVSKDVQGLFLCRPAGQA